MRRRACTRCGCTDARACRGGCAWMPPPLVDVCTACATAMERRSVPRPLQYWVGSDVILGEGDLVLVACYARECLEGGYRPGVRDMGMSIGFEIPRRQLLTIVDAVRQQLERQRLAWLAKVLPA